jgi:hypothetical protein
MGAVEWNKNIATRPAAEGSDLDKRDCGVGKM